MRIALLSLSIVLFVSHSSRPSFAPDTQIYTPNRFVLMRNLQSRQTILSYNEHKQSLASSTTQDIRVYRRTHAYKVICDDGISFVTIPEQRMMHYESHTWRTVQDLVIGDRLLCYDNSFTTVSAITLLIDEISLCHVTVPPHHTLLVTPRGLIAHNHPIAIFAVASPVISALSKVAIVGAIGGALWSLFGKKKNRYKNHFIQESSPSGCSSPPPPEDPRNKTKYKNMKQVFEESPIGEKLKKVTRRTKFRYKGAKIYKVIQDVEEWGIKKGDWLYLDTLHYDHLEVFDKSGEVVRTILNMDGTQNAMKLKQAGVRSIAECIG